MIRNTLRSEAGFTYIAAIVMVVILGIMSAQAAGVWTTTMQRERETELLFRGTQIRDALRLWYGMAPCPDGVPANAPPVASTVIKPGTPGPGKLEDLLQAPSSAGKKRFLRKLYLDPIKGKEEEWFLIKDASQRVVGVRSTSEDEPIMSGKDAEFPFTLRAADFQGKKKYSEWVFICDHCPQAAAAGTITGLPPGSGSPQIP